MWGTEAKKLLLGLKKSAWIPEYNAKGVQQSQKEVRELANNVSITLDAVGDEMKNPFYSSGMLIHHGAAEQ